jgi:arylsulfatase A-like enzyme
LSATGRQLCRGLAGLLAGAAWLAAGCGGGSEPVPHPNLLLITIDTLRADRLSLLGNQRKTSPSIDAWAADGVIFESAYAPRGQTWPSLTSLLTGKYPIAHGVRTNGDRLRAEHRTLAESLEAAGYATAAYLTNMGTAPNRGFREKAIFRHPSRPHSEWDRDAVQAAIEFLERRRDMPFFLWLHLMEPHEPYHPPATYAEWIGDYAGSFTGDSEQLDRVALDPSVPFDAADKTAILALYDGQIAATDARLALLLRALRELGLEDDTLVILTADHGEELLDHNRYAFHAASIYDSVLRVPLALRLPGRISGGRRIQAAVELIDVLPTVCELLSVPAPPGVQGESLVPLIDGVRAERRRSEAFFEWSPPEGMSRPGVSQHIFAVRQGRWKLVSNPEDLRPWNRPYARVPGSGFLLSTQELYDVAADPHETRNLASAEPEVAARLAARLEAWLAEALPEQGGADAPTPETLRQLRQLGYIDGP